MEQSLDSQWGEEENAPLSMKQLYLSLPCEVDSKFSAEHLSQKDSKKTLESKFQALNKSERRPVPIYNLERILAHIDPKAMYIFDIDETLVMSPPNQFRGLTAIENHLLELSGEIWNSTHNVDFVQYIQMFVEERYRERLDSKMLTEGAFTLELIKRLQAHGCWVFGLTSRYAHAVSRTDDMLARIGIDFSGSTPLPTDLSLQDPGTQAVYARGIIYTNAVDKGVVLNRFMENVLLRHVLDEKAKQDKAAPGERRDTDKFALDAADKERLRIPSCIVFVDDRVSNVESILTGVPLADQLQIPIYGYHYLAACLDREIDPSEAKNIPLPYDLEAHNNVDIMLEQLIYIRKQLHDASVINCIDTLMEQLRASSGASPAPSSISDSDESVISVSSTEGTPKNF